MNDERRFTAREIAQRHLAAGDPLGWFEALYAHAASDAGVVPWADLAPNPNLMAWLDEHPVEGAGRRALTIGCGLGDDAEALARRGFETTAFDISPTAVSWCTRRFPESRVHYTAADLLAAPPSWNGAFDLVLESYTIQVLPPALRPQAMACAAGFVASGGMLVVIARGREVSDDPGGMPWPLTRSEMEIFETLGLVLRRFEDFVDGESPPVRRFRAVYERPA